MRAADGSLLGLASEGKVSLGAVGRIPPTADVQSNKRSVLSLLRSLKQTPRSQEVLDGIEAGAIDPKFTSKPLTNGARGKSRGDGKPSISRLQSKEDQAATVLHEGRHELDFNSGMLRDRRTDSPAVVLEAEMRAAAVEGEFAVVNDLRATAAFRSGRALESNPRAFASGGQSAYKLEDKLSDADVLEILGRVLEFLR